MNRPDLCHPFVEDATDPGRCHHWFHWLGGNQLCGMKEIHPYHGVPEELNCIADVVLAYRPKPKSKGAKRRTRRAKKAKAEDS
jgi:hypothetical protein